MGVEQSKTRPDPDLEFEHVCDAIEVLETCAVGHESDPTHRCHEYFVDQESDRYCLHNRRRVVAQVMSRLGLMSIDLAEVGRELLELEEFEDEEEADANILSASEIQ